MLQTRITIRQYPEGHKKSRKTPILLEYPTSVPWFGFLSSLIKTRKCSSTHHTVMFVSLSFGTPQKQDDGYSCDNKGLKLHYNEYHINSLHQLTESQGRVEQTPASYKRHCGLKFWSAVFDILSLSCFSAVSKNKYRALRQIRRRRLPSKLLPIHYVLIILTFVAIASEILAGLWNKVK